MKSISSVLFTRPNGRLTKKRPEGEDFYLILLCFDTPSDPCWFYSECFIGTWKGSAQALDRFLLDPFSDDPDAPLGRCKVRIRIYQGDDAREMIQVTKHWNAQHQKQKEAQRNN